MAPRSPSQVTREQLRSPADIRRAERALQKDLRFMIRENRRRRARNEKGPGGVKLADEFAELRQAQLAVSQRAAHLVKTQFPEKNAWLFRLRENARLALSFVPDWAAKLVPRGAGPSNQSRHDEGRQNGPVAQDRSGNAPVVQADQRGRATNWVDAAEGKNQKRTAHTAAALSELMKSVPDLEAWYRTEPRALNRTRDLFASAEQRHAERTPQQMDFSSYQYTDEALLPQGPPASPNLGPAPVSEYSGQNNWAQYPDQAEWSQPTAPHQWAQQAGPPQWAQQAGPPQWAQQAGPPQWAQETAPAQWAQQNRAAPWSQVSPIEWSPGAGSVPSSPQVDQTPQFKVDRKPLPTNNDQISRTASLSSQGPVNGPGSVTPPPMRQSSPKPRRAMS